MKSRFCFEFSHYFLVFLKKQIRLLTLIFMILFIPAMGSYAAETRLLMVQGFPEVEDADALETLFSYNLSAPLGSHSEHVRFDCESENGITEDFLIQNMVSVFGDAAEDDLCIFYYCGHGIHNKNNEYIGVSLGNGRIYSYEKLASDLAASTDRTIITILDSCGSESFYTKGVSSLPNESDRNRFLCLSSAPADSSSYSFSDKEYFINNGRHTPFSYSLWVGMGGLDGKMKADLDADSTVSVQELFQYALFYVLPLTGHLSENYTPTLHTQNPYTELFHMNPDKVLMIEPPYTEMNVWEGNPTKTLSVSTVVQENMITWSSTRPEIAEVSADGTVMANTNGLSGITFIEARSEDRYGRARVQVNQPTVSFPNLDAFILPVKRRFRPDMLVIGPDTEIRWNSEDESVVSVDETGEVKGVGKGVTTLRAATVSDETAIDVYVPEIYPTAPMPYPTRTTFQLRLPTKNAIITEGKDYRLLYQLCGLGTEEISVKSDDSSGLEAKIFGERQLVLRVKKAGVYHVTCQIGGTGEFELEIEIRPEEMKPESTQETNTEQDIVPSTDISAEELDEIYKQFLRDHSADYLSISPEFAYLLYDLDGDGKNELFIRYGDGDEYALEIRSLIGEEVVSILPEEFGQSVFKVTGIYDCDDYSKGVMCIAQSDGEDINVYNMVQKMGDRIVLVYRETDYTGKNNYMSGRTNLLELFIQAD